MSGLPPEADITPTSQHVRFVPTGDISLKLTAQTEARAAGSLPVELMERLSRPETRNQLSGACQTRINPNLITR
jgi:hypothetical protein